MLRKLVGTAVNCNIKTFWCKRCKKPVDVIYKDENGESYCEDCKPKDVTDTLEKHNK